MFIHQKGIALAAIVASTMSVACQKAQSDAEVATLTSEGAASVSMSGDLADSRGQALVRIVNAVPGSNGLQVMGDTGHMMPASSYKDVTDYHPIDNTWVKFEVMGSAGGVAVPLEANREFLTDGHRYTMVVMRDEEKSRFTTRVLRDEIAMDPSQAHLRVIHAAPNAGEINVRAKGGDEWFNGVNFTSEAGFKDLAPWSGAIEIRGEEGNKLLLTTPTIDMQSGKYYSLVVSRSPSGKLESFWFEDSPTTAM